jgi:hypothetical protein
MNSCEHIVVLLCVLQAQVQVQLEVKTERKDRVHRGDGRPPHVWCGVRRDENAQGLFGILLRVIPPTSQAPLAAKHQGPEVVACQAPC